MSLRFLNSWPGFLQVQPESLACDMLLTLCSGGLFTKRVPECGFLVKQGCVGESALRIYFYADVIASFKIYRLCCYFSQRFLQKFCVYIKKFSKKQIFSASSLQKEISTT